MSFPICPGSGEMAGWPQVQMPAMLVLAVCVAIVAVFSTCLTAGLVAPAQAITMFVVLAFFIYVGRRYPDVRCAGWSWILVGLNLITFGCLVSTLHDLLFAPVATSMSGLEFEQWLERIVGFAVGFALLGFGFYRWVPSFLESKLVMASHLVSTERTVQAQQGELRRSEELRLRERQLVARALQSEKLASLGELVSGVAHELNNPLAIVSGYAELLESSELPSDCKEILHDVTKAAFRCKKIVASLLTFARQHKHERQVTDVNAVLEEALSLRDYQFRCESIQVVRELSPLPLTMADPFQLQQVFFNLVNNAYQALLTVPKPRRLVLRSSVVEGNVRVEVQDTGPGMTPEVMKRCFDPFFTTKKAGEGTGLGLSVSFGIVHEHGGTLSASSAPGEGACFRVELPIVRHADDPADGTAEATAPRTAVLAGKRVLIVDDEERIADICRLGLERRGCRVDVASTGEEALAKVTGGSWDLLVSDLRMPGLGGAELFGRLRADHPELERRVLFITGDAAGDDAKQFVEMSGRKHLVKPFGLADLERLAIEVLEAADGRPGWPRTV